MAYGWRLALAALYLLLSGCQQLSQQGSQAPTGKFIEGPRARPLAMQPSTQSPWLNNALVDYLAGAPPDDRVRGFGNIDLAQQMAQVDSFQAPAMQAYAERVLEKLLAQWPHKRPPINIRFSSSESFSAYALADNTIYVTLGTLQAIESEDELAALLGHEAAHLLLGHLNREHFFNQQKKLLDASVNLVNLGVTLSGLESQGSGDSRQLALGNPEAVGKTVVNSTMSGMVLKAVSDNFWNSGWNRAQEDEADLLSIDLLSRAGYSPRGAVHSIQRLQHFEGQRQSQLSQYQARQSALFNQAFRKKGFSGIIEQGIDSTLSSATLFATDIWSDFGKTHRLPAEREQNLQDYVANEYRAERRRRLNLTAYQSQLLSGDNGRLLADQVLINRATKALDSGQLAQARELAEQIDRGPTHGSMRAQTLQFILAIRQQRYDEGLSSLEEVREDEWQYASLTSYDQIIGTSLREGKTTQAEHYLRKGQAHWGREPMAPLEILVHLQAKRVNDAQEAYQRCQGAKSKVLLAQCERHIGRFKPQDTSVNPLKKLAIPGLSRL